MLLNAFILPASWNLPASDIIGHINIYQPLILLDISISEGTRLPQGLSGDQMLNLC